VQDRSKTNVFVIDCEEEEIRKKRSFVLLWNKAKKNEYNRSSTIEDLPLLVFTFANFVHTSVASWASCHVVNRTSVAILERVKGLCSPENMTMLCYCTL
jgi:hypothetical protein